MNTSKQEDQGAVSIREFCKNHGFSVSMFYKMRGKGQAPEVLKIGNRRIVTREAASRWLSRLERAI